MPSTVLHGPGSACSKQCEQLARAGAQSFVTAFQSFEYLDAAEQTAPLFAQIGGALRGLIAHLPQTIAFLTQIRQRLAGAGQARLQFRLGGAEFLQLHVERSEMFGGLFAALQQAQAFAGQIIDLGFVADGVVLEPAGLAHAFDVFVFLALHLLAQFAEARFRGLQLLFALPHVLTLLLTGRLDLAQFVADAAGRLGQYGDVAAQLRAALSRLRQFLVDVVGQRPFVGQRRLVPSDLLAHFGKRRRLFADTVIELGQRFLQLVQLLLPGVGLSHLLGQLRAHPIENGRLFLQTFAQLVKLAQTECDAQLFQTLASIPDSAAPWPLAA